METLTDASGRTSLAEVFAIGDGARFGGAHAAMAQGVLAAAAIAADLGLKIAEPREARRAQRRAARFQAALGCSRRRRSTPTRSTTAPSSVAARR